MPTKVQTPAKTPAKSCAGCMLCAAGRIAAPQHVRSAPSHPRDALAARALRRRLTCSAAPRILPVERTRGGGRPGHRGESACAARALRLPGRRSAHQPAGHRGRAPASSPTSCCATSAFRTATVMWSAACYGRAATAPAARLIAVTGHRRADAEPPARARRGLRRAPGQAGAICTKTTCSREAASTWQPLPSGI